MFPDYILIYVWLTHSLTKWTVSTWYTSYDTYSLFILTFGLNLACFACSDFFFSLKLYRYFQQKSWIQFLTYLHLVLDWFNSLHNKSCRLFWFLHCKTSDVWNLMDRGSKFKRGLPKDPTKYKTFSPLDWLVLIGLNYVLFFCSKNCDNPFPGQSVKPWAEEQYCSFSLKSHYRYVPSYCSCSLCYS